jgi:hypothetical protein
VSEQAKKPLMSHYFGRFGNYGSGISVKVDENIPCLEVTNHAYGELQTTMYIGNVDSDTKELKAKGE